MIIGDPPPRSSPNYGTGACDALSTVVNAGIIDLILMGNHFANWGYSWIDKEDQQLERTNRSHDFISVRLLSVTTVEFE